MSFTYDAFNAGLFLALLLLMLLVRRSVRRARKNWPSSMLPDLLFVNLGRLFTLFMFITAISVFFIPEVTVIGICSGILQTLLIYLRLVSQWPEVKDYGDNQEKHGNETEARVIFAAFGILILLSIIVSMHFGIP